jgi:hypothetical protein
MNDQTDGRTYDPTDDGYSPAKRWTLAATVLVVLGYAWLGSRLSEPRLVFPEAIHNAVWIEKLDMRSLRGMSQFGAPQFLEWSRLFAQAKRLKNELAFLEPFDSRVDLLIDVDNRRSYSVSDRRIVMGLDIAASEGQLLKAFVKAWLFQKAAPAVQASQLRMEVASDVAVGMIRGHFALGTPSGQTLQLPSVENWLKHVSSFANSCDEIWLPFEIGSFCGTSNHLNPLILRPLLSAMVMESYQAIPPFQRLNFARQWLATLRDESTLGFRPPADSMTSWRSWVREEAQGFMRLAPDKMDEKINEAGLTEESPLKVDLQLRMENWRAQTDVTSKKLVAVVVSPKGERTLEPSGLPLSKEDLATIETTTDVWANCETPNAQSLLNSPIESKAILYLACEPEKAIEFSGMSRGGIRIFARENREIPFVYLNRSALALALSKKLIEPSVPVNVVLGAGSQLLSPLLGLENPQWNAPMRAFHVIGAVEAVEWFRSPAKMPPHAYYQAP